jgi:hypothetical protein
VLTVMTRALMLALLGSCAPRPAAIATHPVPRPAQAVIGEPQRPQLPRPPIPVGRSRISGTVTDFITHVPMQGVLVVIEAQSRIEQLAVTDDRGVYVLDAVKPAEYRVSLSYEDVVHETTLHPRRGSEIVFDYQFARGVEMPHPLPVAPPILPF